ncbi:MAG: signal peptide peptidase SppA [Planctomycetaceae bacterium]
MRREWMIVLFCLFSVAMFVNQGTNIADEKRPLRVDWAEIKISGSYPETSQMPGLFGDLTESLPTILDRMDQAARDKSLKGVLLHIDGVEIGWAKLNELQAGIRKMREAGKTVWARMNDAGTRDYLLACSCERIIMPESSTIMITGLRAEVTFYRNLFEMLDIKADMLRVGAYKSAAEPYTRTEMSDEFRAEMEEILDAFYQIIVTQISESRKLSEEQVKAIIDEGIHSAGRAKELGLLDDIAYEDELAALIRNGQDIDLRMRSDYRKKKPNTELDLFSLMEILGGGKKDMGSTRPRIAVVYAEGPITSGNSPTGLFGEAGISSDKLVPLIQKLGKDENVKAIVLRVDSPGGSALASDLIWRALEATEKPLVVSMGDVAASGGYYISMGAEKIFAEPGTITGSIGVVGGKLSFEGLMKKVGVTQSVVQRGRNSGVLSVTEAFTESGKETMQRMLNTIYEQFTRKAAAGRKMDYEKLEAMARGRVYTGVRAKALGLVDEVGTLDDAIAHARVILNDTEKKLELDTLPKPQSPLEMLLGHARHQQAQPVARAFAELLPAQIRPAIRHLDALNQLAKEPALTILPYSLRIE